MMEEMQTEDVEKRRKYCGEGNTDMGWVSETEDDRMSW